VIVSRSQRRFRELPGRAAANPLEAADVQGMSMRVVVVHGGAPRSPHRHPHSQEVIYVASGRGRLWQEGVLRRFQEGDCALIGRGEAHATIPDPGESMELVCFWPHPELEKNIEEMDDVIALEEGTAR
jgi:quercetin dioxygenase-like cupin family protein